MPSKRAQFKTRIKQRQEDAAWRQERYEKLDTREKLDRLDGRPGECKRERAKLLDKRDQELVYQMTI